jgi:hypothetical protein
MMFVLRGLGLERLPGTHRVSSYPAILSNEKESPSTSKQWRRKHPLVNPLLTVKK